MKRKMLSLCVLSLLAVVMSCTIYQMFFALPHIQSHQGDGRFENHSHRIGPFAISGYSIMMPKFVLNKPKHIEYRLTKLPYIRRRCGVFFAVNTDDDNWREKLQIDLCATLQLEIIGSSGETVVNLSGKLSDFTVYSSSVMDFIALYPRNNNSVFVPDPREKYIVRIIYTPDPKLKDYQGFVFFECGGSK